MPEANVLDYSIPPSDRNLISSRNLFQTKTRSALPLSASQKAECEILPSDMFIDRSNTYLKFTMKVTGGGYCSAPDCFKRVEVRDRQSGAVYDTCEDYGLAHRVLGYVRHSANYRDNHNQQLGMFGDSIRPFIGTGTVEVKGADLDAVLGTTSEFATEVVAGDRILFSTGAVGTVATVTNDTTIDLSADLAVAVPAGTKYLIIPNDAKVNTYYNALNGADGVEVCMELGSALGFFRETYPFFPLKTGIFLELQLNSDPEALQTPNTAAALTITNMHLVYDAFTLKPAPLADWQRAYMEQGLKVVFKSHHIDTTRKWLANSAVLTNQEFTRKFSSLDMVFFVRRLESNLNSRSADQYAFTSGAVNYQAKWKDMRIPADKITSTQQLYIEYFRNIGLLGETDQDSISWEEFYTTDSKKCKNIICHNWKLLDDGVRSGIHTSDSPVEYEIVYQTAPTANVQLALITSHDREIFMKFGETPVVSE